MRSTEEANGLHEEPLREQVRRGVDELKGVREEFASVSEDLRILAQKESELARAEMREQVAYGRNGAILAALAAVFGLITLAFFATTAMFALDLVMPLWLAALITAAGLLFLTAALGLVGFMQFRKITVAPKKTMESVSEDLRWLRSRLTFSAK